MSKHVAKERIMRRPVLTNEVVAVTSIAMTQDESLLSGRNRGMMVIITGRITVSSSRISCTSDIRRKFRRNPVTKKVLFS